MDSFEKIAVHALALLTVALAAMTLLFLLAAVANIVGCAS